MNSVLVKKPTNASGQGPPMQGFGSVMHARLCAPYIKMQSRNQNMTILNDITTLYPAVVPF